MNSENAMQINLYATFRLHAGVRRFDLDLPDGVTLKQAIEAIVEQYPVLHNHWLDEYGNLYAHVHAFINGVDAGTLPDGLNTPLKPADVLDFFPPVAGG
jgi:sulfur-carrier protein